VSTGTPTAPTLITSQDALHNLCLADPLWVERYQGWTELGHGGSATVVRTHGKALGDDLALKVFPRLSADDWTRFRTEVRNAQRLTSPYIVRTYSPFPRTTFAWIELELIEGENLKQALERRSADNAPFTFDESLDIAVALTTALATAHAAEVIHRDVKPANVLLPRDGHPVAKLGDFGISRLSNAVRLTKTGLLVGTPQFAAPEVVAGQAAGPASDVYSLSLCVYLLLSNNRFPFRVSEDSPPTHWLRAHAEEAPLALSAVRPDAPAVLVDLVELGLAKDPLDRPTAQQFLDTLRSLRGESETASAPLPSRRRGARSLAGVGVLSLAVAGAWILGQRDRVVAPTGEAADGNAPAQAPVTTLAALARAPAETTLPAAPEPAPPPAASARSGPFHAVLEADMLTIGNSGGGAFRALRIALVSADGRRHTRVFSDGLGPEEAVSFPLDSFVPVPSSRERLRRVEITAEATTGSAPLTAVVALP
jgi:eukaryotic-like serine/threonine-protein kinase